MNEIHIDPHSIAESNARVTARGNYSRWLLKRFQHLHLLDMVGDMDPISLRRIFVPLQVAEREAREETKLGNDEQQGRLPGEALWDVLGREPALLLSGKPGCGKSTLVQAMVVDLVSEFSELRSKVAKPPGIFPIPIILRNYPIETIQSLDALLDYWWEEAKKQAEADKHPLDIERLKFSFDPKGDAFPVILLLDGIDETGGQKNRQKILDFALEAGRRSWRVLLTGRPDGFAGLQLRGKNKKKWSVREEFFKRFHVLPFAWPQIERFVKDWYRLLPAWERQKQLGVERFLAALQDKNRSYLLSLARRPIFLTLMAHVHCTDSQMPEGRAALYGRIVDLYINRQEKHRRLEKTPDGDVIHPHWDQAEKRLILEYLAWQSQNRVKDGDEDSRQVIWKKTEMIKAIKTQLDTSEYGYFTTLKPGDAENLLKYFLWPTGLLVELSEDSIQFAHLSFQEYLCAGFLYQSDPPDRKKHLMEQLFRKIGNSGWMEVASLFLYIYTMSKRKRGHFQMLSWLDPSDRFHAKLLMQSICGGELPFTEKEQIDWLPLAMACVLLHPMDYTEPLPFAGLSNEVRQKGREILVEIFEGRKDALEVLAKNFKGYSIKSKEGNYPWKEAEDRWNNPPEKDDSWTVSFGHEEAQMQGLILLSAALGEGGDEPFPGDGDMANGMERIWKFAPDGALAMAMAKGLKKDWGKIPSAFWKERKDFGKKLLFPTLSASMLNMISPESGKLWKRLTENIPPAYFLLQGEEFLDSFDCLDAIFLSFYPVNAPPPRLVLSLSLYQLLVIAETLPIIELSVFSKEKSLSLLNSQLQPQLQPQLQLQLQLQLLSRLELQLQSQPRSRLESLSRLESRSRSRLRSRLLLQSRLQSLSESLSESLSLPQLRSGLRSESRSQLRSLLASYGKINSSTIADFKNIIKDMEKLLDRKNLKASVEETIVKTVIAFGFQIYAWDWFDEQSNGPDLMNRRGMKSDELLPAHLGLFDAKGFPLPEQKRENWIALKNWLGSNNAVLDFCFEGKELSAPDREILLDDLEYLKTCSWSPHEAIRIAVENWPKNKDGSYDVCAFDLDVFVKGLEGVVDEISSSLTPQRSQNPIKALPDVKPFSPPVPPQKSPRTRIPGGYNHSRKKTKP